MTILGVQVGKRPNLRSAGYAVIELFSSIIKILTLGTVYPVWDMYLLTWELDRKVKQSKTPILKSEPIRLTTGQ